jgi:hypothetical protein
MFVSELTPIREVKDALQGFGFEDCKLLASMFTQL